MYVIFLTVSAYACIYRVLPRMLKKRAAEAGSSKQSRSLCFQPSPCVAQRQCTLPGVSWRVCKIGVLVGGVPVARMIPSPKMHVALQDMGRTLRLLFRKCGQCHTKGPYPGPW